MRLLWLALALVSCGPRDIVFIDLPPIEDGGRPEFGEICINNSDCRMPMSVCEKTSCGATSGRCKRKPFCDAVFAPVCGCNNVTYWNDCLRMAQGIQSKVIGQCEAPVTCTAAAPCPSSAFCALLLEPASSCSMVPSGVCWFVPLNCPVGDTSYESCSGAPVCGGLCSAIRSGAIRRQVNSCP